MLEDDFASRTTKYEACGNSPVRGMESVVATVSGYGGQERFKVIKLITNTGANYVGAMTKSTTHLVCWQFEGRKYSLAKKFGTKIVNHRWFEDCLREGKILPEDKYSTKSGHQVGPLSWEVPVIIINCEEKDNLQMKMKGKGVCDWSKARNDGKARENYTSLDGRCLPWLDSHLLREPGKLLATERNRRDVCGAVGNGASTKPVCKRRRIGMNTTSIDQFNHISVVPRNLSNTRTESTSKSGGRKSQYELRSNRENWDLRLDEVNEISQSNNLSTSSSSDTSHYDVNLSFQDVTSQNKFCGTEGNTEGGVEHVNELKQGSQFSPASTELSCVICWTDFSSTRGVLPCGHRFCYSCIQSWADHMTCSGKVSACPLCKASFLSIRKMEDAASHDQKIYSQTLPCASSSNDVFLLQRDGHYSDTKLLSVSSVCYKCCNREPEDLLLSCQICQIRWVHSFCLDPPLIPWTCIHCKDLRMLYQRFRIFLTIRLRKLWWRFIP